MKSSRYPSSSSSSSSAGTGFIGLLGILFIGLKLTGYVSWPWVWVLAPIWISALVVLALLGILIIVSISKK